jgi:predicted TPR repeat methyltransferase
MNNINFDKYSFYYDLLYKNKDYASEAKYIDKIIKLHSANYDTILELGSGTGTYGLILEKLDYNVYGIEKSSGMVTLAKEKNFQCEEGNIVDFNLNKKYDNIISLFHVMSYITDNDDLIKAFKNISCHLNSGGLFIFDAWYLPAVISQKATPTLKKISNNEVDITRFAEPISKINENIIDVNFEILIKTKKRNTLDLIIEQHSMRYFSIPEIKLFSQLAGLEFLYAEEFLTSNSPSINTWGVTFVLKKH